MLTSPRRCAGCGQPLVVLVAQPTVAPWHCDVCGKSWWDSELTAKERWNRVWGWSNPIIRSQVLQGVQDEIAAATARGTSLRPDQVGLVDVGTLAALAQTLQESGLEARREFAGVLAEVAQQRGVTRVPVSPVPPGPPPVPPPGSTPAPPVPPVPPSVGSLPVSQEEK